MGYVSAGCGVRLRKDDPSVGETKSARAAQERLFSSCDIREIGQDLLPTERLFQEMSRPCPCEGVGVYVGWERPGPKGLAGARFPGCPGKRMNPRRSAHGGLVGKGVLRVCQGERARI